MSLSVKNLTFCYLRKNIPAVNDFSYTFRSGMFYGIFGAKGSGKSTLLKILAGDLPAEQAVLLEDMPLQQLSSRSLAQLMAYAPQEEELLLPFTVKECIALGRYAWNDKNISLIDRLLKEWNVEHLSDKQFAELSGGERQKIKLLRILAQDTSYILLDEPSSALDFPKQIELYEKLQKVAHEENKCIIMVCHDLYIAPGIIDEMLLLKKGRLIYSGKSGTPEAAKATGEAFEREFVINRQGNNIEISW